MKKEKEKSYVKFVDGNGKRISWDEYVGLKDIKETIKKSKL